MALHLRIILPFVKGAEYIYSPLLPSFLVSKKSRERVPILVPGSGTG